MARCRDAREQDEIREAVIGSGEGHPIEEWFETCGARVARSCTCQVPGSAPVSARRAPAVAGVAAPPQVAALATIVMMAEA